MIDQQIRSTIDAQLAKKGLTETDSNNANLRIGYQTAVTTEKQLSAWITGWGYGGG